MSRLIVNLVFLAVVGGIVGGVDVGSLPSKSGSLSDEELYKLVQERTFQYFYEGAENNSKLASERIHVDGYYDDYDYVPTVIQAARDSG
jgi:hypothetical protein